MKKGFVTIAYGEYYHVLAQNLLLSYRYNVPKEKQLPFAVITDHKSRQLEEFDDVIISEPSDVGFINKLYFGQLSPYDESIFIDADCLVYGDISVFFEKYEENGSPVSSFGRNIDPLDADKIHNIMFDIKKAKKTWDHISHVPHFNAATYYCDNSSGGGTAVLLTAQKLYEEKGDYSYPFWGDEPYVALAMAIHGCKCCAYEGSVYFGSHAKICNADILNHRFEAITYGRKTTAPLLHWSTLKTHHALYEFEVKRLKNDIDKDGKAEVSKVWLPLLYLKWWTYYIKVYTKAYCKAAWRRVSKRKD